MRFIIAPGNGGCGDDIHNSNWYGWLDTKLREKGHESVCVDWPDPYVCHQSNWIPFARDTLKADTRTVIVGHSTGALLAMRLMEQHKIYGAILVAAAHTDLGDEGERASGFFDKPWDFEAMKRNATFIHQFHSSDDHLIPVREARFVAKALEGNNHVYQELKGRSHFFEPFPELLDCVDRYVATFQAESSSSCAAAEEFIALWQSGACDDQAHAALARLLERVPLSGRMTHGDSHDPEFGRGLLSSDRWKRLSWIFGSDALPGFLGKSAREICLQLGFGEKWLDDKIPKGKKFKLAIFPSLSVDAQPATWDGIRCLVERTYPEVWPKILRHLPQIRAMRIEEIEAQANYKDGLDMLQTNLVARHGGALDTEGESDSENYISLQRLLKREGTLVEVRQFLWDEVGVKGLYSGDGYTLSEDGKKGVREYLARNRRLEDIEGCVLFDVDPS